MNNSKPRLIASIVIPILLFTIILDFLGLFAGVENKYYDFKMNIKTILQPINSSDITIIAIDDKSISKSSDPWPWSRKRYAQLLDNLRLVHPKVIAFDVLFTNVMEPEGDKIFEQAIKQSSNVVLASRFIKLSDTSIKKFLPIPQFLINASGTGIVDIPPEQDGVIRKSWLIRSYVHELFYSFPLTILSYYSNTPLSTIDLNSSAESIILGKYELPLSNKGDFPIYYFGEQKTFPTYSFIDLLNTDFVVKHKQAFANKIVLIGATSMELNDLFTTPVGLRYPGVEIHASILHSFIQKLFIKEMPYSLFFVGLITLILGNALLFLYLNPRKGLVILILETLAIPLTGIGLMTYSNYSVVAISPLVALWLLFLAVTITKYILQEREKGKLKQMFSRYVSNQVVEELLQNHQNIILGGKLQTVTILFSDIKDFTTLSEKLSAQEVVSILNRYFTIMIDIVFSNNGTLDKYVGDAIMATFGVPVESETAAFDAVKTAYEMHQGLDKLNLELVAENLPPISIRIGVNTGEVVVGNIGSPKRMEYTVIGDHVNIASRLEGLNKKFDSKIIISENTYLLVKDRIQARFLEDVAVKGKTKTVKIFEVLSLTV
ncbi:MAG TPA: hypothetical protein DF296_09250 [Candidatus Margulisbacteria bacterium]|nr:MAG: hypothetical protein A2X41_05855 [Candidatus Margulisbacteria bacterium GWE2_39_32]HCT85373.1 hypothetical protein [Candidatus Margulisiibacteriota bacterium]